MGNDIFSDVAKGLSALGDEARQLVSTVSMVPSEIARIRSELHDHERTKELLEQIEQHRRRLHEVHQTVTSYVKSFRE